MKRQFAQIDVFTDTPYAGNPVAVYVNASPSGSLPASCSEAGVPSAVD